MRFYNELLVHEYLHQTAQQVICCAVFLCCGLGKSFSRFRGKERKGKEPPLRVWREVTLWHPLKPRCGINLSLSARKSLTVSGAIIFGSSCAVQRGSLRFLICRLQLLIGSIQKTMTQLNAIFFVFAAMLPLVLNGRRQFWCGAKPSERPGIAGG